MNEAERDMKNYADRVGCVLSAEVDNTLQNLPNFSHPMKAEFINYFKTTQSRPKVFSVNDAVTCNCAALLTSSVD